MQETVCLEKEEEEQKKILKQEALQLLKKKEKTENIIKVCTCSSIQILTSALNFYLILKHICWKSENEGN